MCGRGDEGNGDAADLRWPTPTETVTYRILPINQERLSGRTTRLLDASRALAALAVVLQHARTALLVDAVSVSRPGAFTKALYWCTGFGHQAVVVFFVLSGALVGGSVMRSASVGAWSWHAYLIRRLSRLYIVLIPALALVLLWDGLGMAVFPVHALYRDVMSAVTIDGHTLIVHNRSALAVLGNVTFVMKIYVPVLGSGEALWSLGNEFWYYILFPCAVLAVISRRSSWRSLAYIVLVLGIALFVGRNIVEWMSVWLLGAVAVQAPRLRISPPRTSRLVAAALVIFFVATALERTLLNVVSLRGDLVVGTSFALLLYCAFCRDSAGVTRAVHQRWSGIWKAFAGFSYTLYLFHQPPLAFANAWLNYAHHSRWQPTAAHVGTMLGAVLLLVLYSYAWSRVTEARTENLRRALTHGYDRLRGTFTPVARRSSSAIPSAR